MPLIDVPTPHVNGVSRIPEPTSAKEAEQILTGPALTEGYKPTLPIWTYADYKSGLGNWQMLHDIEPMLTHPRVCHVYDTYKAAIHHAEFNVKANSPEIQRYVEIMYRRFWERSLTQSQFSYDYGWNGYEVMWGKEKGYLTFEGLEDFSPFDTWALTKQHRYRGLAVSCVPGAAQRVTLWGPQHWPSKGFWLTHNRRWNRWYGRTQMWGAWRPWRRLAQRDAMEDVLDGGWYRFAYRGPIVRFPAKAFTGPDGLIDFKGARDRSREWAEQWKTGMSSALPSTRDANGNYEWDLSEPTQTIRLDGLIEVVKYLCGEIAFGVGVPPELTEAQDASGGGWSGRKIPLIGFYTTQLKNARHIVGAAKHQIFAPAVLWNFGPSAKFEVDVILSVPDVLNPQPGAGPSPGGGGPPGAAGGGPPGAPAPPGAAPPTGAPPQPKRPPTAMSTADPEETYDTYRKAFAALLDGERL